VKLMHRAEEAIDDLRGTLSLVAGVAILALVVAGAALLTAVFR
jgi:hypothetical protein